MAQRVRDREDLSQRGARALELRHLRNHLGASRCCWYRTEPYRKNLIASLSLSRTVTRENQQQTQLK